MRCHVRWQEARERKGVGGVVEHEALLALSC